MVKPNEKRGIDQSLVEQEKRLNQEIPNIVKDQEFEEKKRSFAEKFNDISHNIYDKITNFAKSSSTARDIYNNVSASEITETIQFTKQTINDIVDTDYSIQSNCYLFSDRPLIALSLNGIMSMLVPIKPNSPYSERQRKLYGNHIAIKQGYKQILSNEVSKRVSKITEYGSLSRYAVPSEGKHLFIDDLGIYVFPNIETANNFLMRFPKYSDIRQIRNTELFNLYSDDTPGITLKIINLSDFDYYVSIADETSCIPKVDPAFVKTIIKNNSLVEYIEESRKTHDVLLYMKIVNYHNSSYDADNNSNIETKEPQAIYIPVLIKKEYRLSTKPIYIDNMNLFLFASAIAAKEFKDGPFKGSFQRYIIHNLNKIYEEKLKEKLKEKEKEEKKYNKHIANLLIMAAASSVVTSTTILTIGWLKSILKNAYDYITSGGNVFTFIIKKAPETAASIFL